MSDLSLASSNSPPNRTNDVMSSGSRAGRRTWREIYARRIAATDFGVLVVVTVLTALIRFGVDATSDPGGRLSVSYLTVSLAIATLWWVCLALMRTRDPKILAEGPEEYRRLLRATFIVFGWVAIVSLMLKFDLSRLYLAVAFPLGLASLVAGRKFWRRRIARDRQNGAAQSTVLLVGGPTVARRIAHNLESSAATGFRVVGIWVPDRYGEQDETIEIGGRNVPVLDHRRNLIDALTSTHADTVIVSDTEHLGHDGLRALAWELEVVDVDLMVSPNVIDVAGPRIHVRAVANMPFIHLERPNYAGASRIGKIAFDKTFATLALVAASPALAVTAIAIRATSPGPVLYRSTRVGVNGVPFEMLKFRTMVVDADSQIPDLQAANQGSGPLFKIKDDPRITSTGRFLRRYSIDELPQLLNVLKGEMSLVGPRPPLPSEVSAYEEQTRKRLLVRQGITGLWQVSGRSDLTWEETVRLDLDYVENWSLTRDLQIIWRTVRAVVHKEGAY